MLNAVDLLNPSASQFLFRLMMYSRMNSTPPASPAPMQDSLVALPASPFITDSNSATSVPTKTAGVENPDVS